ncbi:hypothetical protein [Nocardia sp. NPDC059239]|uniref:hypothetical protein n=1 Tax=unclassified Nocardia TaxID=2637762 RepID=UPI00367F9798
MTEIATRTPPLIHWQAWDLDFQLVGEWSERPAMSELAGAHYVTVDIGRRRDTFRVFGEDLIHQRELLRPILVWRNPTLEPDDHSAEVADIAARYAATAIPGDPDIGWAGIQQALCAAEGGSEA